MTERKPRRRSRWLLVLLLLLIGGTAYGSFRIFRTDPNIKKIREIRKELATTDDSKLTSEQRREKFQQLRESMEKLTPQQRDRMQKEMAADRNKRADAEMKSYAAMTAEQKKQHLDRQIDRMEQGHLRREQQQAAGETTGGSGSGPGGRTSSTSSGPAANGNGGPDPNRPPMTPQQRELRRKEMLDATTPEFRAARDQYRQDLQARRIELGLPPMRIR